MAFTHIETVTGADASSSTAVLSSAATAGDLLVASFYVQNSADDTALTVESGFSQVHSEVTGSTITAIYYKVAAGGETQFALSHSDNTRRLRAVLQRFSSPGTVSAPLGAGATVANALSLTAGPVAAEAGGLLVGIFRKSGSPDSSLGFSGNASNRIAGGLQANTDRFYICDGEALSSSESVTHNLDATNSFQSAALASFVAEESNPTLRKSGTATFDKPAGIGTITGVTLNGNTIDLVGQDATTFTVTDSDGSITTSGAYDLVATGDTVETIVVQVNVVGVTPSNNPVEKDGAAQASLTGVQVRVTGGANLNGAELYYTGTATTDASGNLASIDLSSTAAVETDPVLLHIRTAAGDSIIASETVGLI